MAELVWAVLCADTILDKFSNQLSMMRVIEQMELTPHTPDPLTIGEALPVTATLTSLWFRDADAPEVAQARAVLVGPDGARVEPHGTPLTLNLRDNHRSRLMWTVGAVVFRGFGRYRFVIEKQLEEDGGWERAGSVPFELVLKPTELRQSPP